MNNDENLHHLSTYHVLRAAALNWAASYTLNLDIEVEFSNPVLYITTGGLHVRACANLLDLFHRIKTKPPARFRTLLGRIHVRFSVVGEHSL